MTKKIDRCSLCGAKLAQYTHSLRSGTLPRILVKFAKILWDTGKSSANPAQHGFTINEYNNFQKLKYWGIIEPITVSGKWRLTNKGFLFLANEIALPVEAVTYRGKVIRLQGTEKKMSGIDREVGVALYPQIHDYAQSAKENKQKEIQEALAL